MTRIGATGLGLLAFGVVFGACDPGTTTSTDGGRPDLVHVSPSQVPDLGAARPFAVFGGGAGVTNQGVRTVVNGDLGATGASTKITGFHSSSFSYSETPLNLGTVNGAVVTDTPQGTSADFTLALAVAADALKASNLLAAIPGGIDPGAGSLGGLTLQPGVYKSASGSFTLVGSDLTLDAQGDANGIWVFQMASSLNVGDPGASRSVLLINGAQAKNVFWQVGSSATINGAGGGTMVGTIIASSGVQFSTPGNDAVTTLNGRALGLFASVTMVNTVVNVPESGATVSVLPRMESSLAQVVVGGANAADVAAVAGAGFLDIVNNGGHVAATQIGTGTIKIVNDGGILTATNTGTGTMTINSDATGAVTVTNTGNGNVTVRATGAEAVTVTHTGDGDFAYPATSSILGR